MGILALYVCTHLYQQHSVNYDEKTDGGIVAANTVTVTPSPKPPPPQYSHPHRNIHHTIYLISNAFSLSFSIQ